VVYQHFDFLNRRLCKLDSIRISLSWRCHMMSIPLHCSSVVNLWPKQVVLGRLGSFLWSFVGRFDVLGQTRSWWRRQGVSIAGMPIRCGLFGGKPIPFLQGGPVVSFRIIRKCIWAVWTVKIWDRFGQSRVNLARETCSRSSVISLLHT